MTIKICTTMLKVHQIHAASVDSRKVFLNVLLFTHTHLLVIEPISLSPNSPNWHPASWWKLPVDRKQTRNYINPVWTVQLDILRTLQLLEHTYYLRLVSVLHTWRHWKNEITRLLEMKSKISKSVYNASFKSLRALCL